MQKKEKRPRHLHDAADVMLPHRPDGGQSLSVNMHVANTNADVNLPFIV